MKRAEFIKALTDILEIEGQELNESTNLREFAEFDSMALMTIIALLDEQFGKKITADQFINISTVKSLMELVGMDRFE